MIPLRVRLADRALRAFYLCLPDVQAQAQPQQTAEPLGVDSHVPGQTRRYADPRGCRVCRRRRDARFGPAVTGSQKGLPSSPLYLPTYPSLQALGGSRWVLLGDGDNVCHAWVERKDLGLSLGVHNDGVLWEGDVVGQDVAFFWFRHRLGGEERCRGVGGQAP